MSLRTILRGKTEGEIIEAFANKHSSISCYDLTELIYKCNFAKITKYISFVWGIPLFVFGLTFFLTFIFSGASDFPKIFLETELLFYERFVNVFYGIMLIALSLICMIAPLARIYHVYDMDFLD